MRIYSIINACSPQINEQENNITAFVNKSGINIDELQVIRITGDMEHYNGDIAVAELSKLCSDGDLVLFPSNDSGNELAIKLALRLGGTGLTGVTEVNLEAGLADKKVYAGNLVAEYELQAKPWCLAIDRSIECESQIHDQCYENIELNEIECESSCYNKKIELSDDKGGGLGEAEFVLALGQGLKKQKAVDEMTEVAEIIGATVGASRPVVMNAWSPMENLIGVSGNMIKPKLCITVAASGSPAFFAGIEKSGTIIAINTDEKAPIMKQSDIAITGDAVEIIDQLKELVEGRK